MHRLLLLLTFVSTLTHANYWDTIIDVEGKVGSYRRGVDIVVWTALSQGDSDLLFVQGGGGYWRDHLFGANVGVGYRAKWGSEMAWGANAFVDITAAEHGETYWQGGVGGELMGNCWLVRANGYLPTNNRTLIDEWVVSAPFLQGTQLYSADTHCVSQEQAYRGFDVEAGGGFDLFWGQLWGFGSFFYFDANRVKSLCGPRVRLEYRVYDRCIFGRPIDFMLGGEYEWNQLHGHTGSATAWVRVPFGGDESRRCCSNGLCKQMGDPVIRERSIWVDRQICRRQQTVDLGQQLFVITSKESLSQAIGAAAEGDLFVVSGAELDVSGLPNVSWELKRDQSIFGPERVIVRGGRELTLSGERPSLKTTPTNAVIIPCGEADSTNRIFGLDVMGGLHAIKSKDPMEGHLEIRDVTVRADMTHAVDVTASGEVTIEKCNLGDTGIKLLLSDDAVASVTHLPKVGEIAIDHVGNGASKVTVSHVTGDGVEFTTASETCNHTFAVNDCTLDGTRAIHLNTQKAGSGSINFETKGNTISSEKGSGIVVNGGSEGNLSLNVTTSDNTITIQKDAAGLVGDISFGGIVGLFDWKIANNTIVGTGAGLEMTGLTNGHGIGRVELTENTFGDAKGPRFETALGFRGTLEVSMEKNTCGDTSFVHAGDGHLQVNDLHTLSERNNSTTVTGTGPVQS